VANQNGSFLPDRFDDVPRDVGYVGTHRRQRSTLSLFAPIGVGLALVVVLVLAGLWIIDRSNENLALDVSSVAVSAEPPADNIVVEPAPEEGPNPVEDPTTIDTAGLTITVLNGTSSQGLAARAGARLQAVGWPESTATNADSSSVPASIVAYENDADLDIALGIAQVLGIDFESVVQTSTYPGARITVILGADYVDTEAT
jgi:hypothetical protein